MNKILTRICSVALVGGALAGLAYAGTVAKQKMTAKSQEKVAVAKVPAGAEVVYASDIPTGDETAAESGWNLIGFTNCYYFSTPCFSAGASNSYAYSPALTLEAGHKYQIVINAASFGGPVSYEVKLTGGNNQFVWNAGTTMIAATELNTDGEYVEIASDVYECSTTYTFYAGVKVLSVNDSAFRLADLKVYDVTNAGGGDEPVVPGGEPELVYQSNFPSGDDSNATTGWNMTNFDYVAWFSTPCIASNQAGSYAFSPALNLEAGHKYKVVLNAAALGTVNYEVKFTGMSNSMGWNSGTTVIAANDLATEGSYTEITSDVYECNTTYTYYLGIKLNSQIDGAFRVADVKVYDVTNVGGGDEPVEPEPVEAFWFSDFEHNFNDWALVGDDADGMKMENGEVWFPHDGTRTDVYSFMNSKMIEGFEAKDYTFKFTARTANGGAHKFKIVYAGNTWFYPSEILIDETEVKSTEAKEYKVKLTIPEAGQYRFRVQAVSGEGNDAFILGNITITEGWTDEPDQPEEPEGPTGISVPYTSDYAAGLEDYLIVDGNADGKKWTLSGDALKMTYNSSKEMDDWAITPGFQLEAGKKYALNFNVWKQGYTEKFEVFVGKEQSVAGMTTELVPVTAVPDGANDVTPYAVEGTFVPEESGVYYFGFHGCSPSDQYYLYIGNYTIDEWKEKMQPAAASDFEVAANDMGLLKSHVKFTLPSTNASGNPLSGNMKVEVYRGLTYYTSEPEVLVKTLENQAPGAVVEFDDEDFTKDDDYYYSVVCSNADGESVKAQSASIHVGPVTPGYVQGIVSSLTDNPGELKLSWDPVVRDSGWRFLAHPELVTYTVGYFDTTDFANYEESDFVVIESGVTDTEYVWQAVTEGQKMVKMGVYATYLDRNSQGISDAYPELCGFPYNELDEDFSTEGKYAWDISKGWASTYDMTYGENGGVQFHCTYLYDSNKIKSGLFNLEDYEAPAIIFTVEGAAANLVSLYTQGGDDEWMVQCGDEVVLGSLDGKPGTPVDVKFDLSNYAGKTFKFEAEFAYNYLAEFEEYDIKVTSIRIVDQTAHDLRAGAIVAEPAVPGEEFGIDVTVYNDGIMDEDSFEVALYKNCDPFDGEPLATVEVTEPLAAGESMVVSFTDLMPKLQLDSYVYCARIILDSDQMPTNNVTEMVEVYPAHLSFAPASELNVVEQDSKAYLTWNAAEEVEAPVVSGPVTVDFEDATPWSTAYGDFKFINNAEHGNVEAWGYQAGAYIHNALDKTGWMIYDDQTAKANVLNYANGGKCLMDDAKKESANTWIYDMNDNWVVAPELSGEAQTVKFEARSKSTPYMDYTDYVEIYYSTTGTDEADFVAVENSKVELTITWTELTAELPAGAKYFAIRHTGDNAVCFIDNITFIPADGSAYAKAQRREATYGGKLLGYNVYRDGELVAEKVNGTSYLDADVEIGKQYLYHVTAVYEQGESAPCEPYSFLVTGINGIYDNAAGYDAIYTLSGVRVPADRLAPGVYVVVKNGKSQKITVK